MGKARDILEIEISVSRDGHKGHGSLYVVTHPYGDKNSTVTLYTADRDLADRTAALPIGWWNSKGHVREVEMHDPTSLSAARPTDPLPEDAASWIQNDRQRANKIADVADEILMKKSDERQ